MAKNYTDFVNAMTEAHRRGLSPKKVILTEKSMQSFMTSGDFSERTEERAEQLGEFSIPIKKGDGDYILTNSGIQVPL